jgi:hypothetical protein
MNGDCYLVEIFLPLADNAGRKFPAAKFTRFAEELKLEFNGVTVYDRKPARDKRKTAATTSSYSR